ncbi:MAG: class F sortase [Peptococcaceae bacterium]|nr:class F sortase [Peptococcaceae bacterium]
MKKLRFVLVCTLMVLMTVVLIAGCNKTENPATEDTSTEEVQGKPQFDGDQQIPKTMTIEKIGLKDVAVIPTDTDEKGYMKTPPEADGVTWFEDYASPGWDFNAIFSGHNYYDGVAGTFAKLNELDKGDEVIFTYEDGSVAYFKVYDKNRYPEDEVPENTMKNEEPTRTTLITCDGERKEGGGYPFRIIFLLEATKHLDKDGKPMIATEDEATETPAE